MRVFTVSVFPADVDQYQNDGSPHVMANCLAGLFFKGCMTRFPFIRNNGHIELLYEQVVSSPAS